MTTEQQQREKRPREALTAAIAEYSTDSNTSQTVVLFATELDSMADSKVILLLETQEVPGKICFSLFFADIHCLYMHTHSQYSLST